MNKKDYTPKSPREGVGAAIVVGAILIIVGLTLLYIASMIYGLM